MRTPRISIDRIDASQTERERFVEALRNGHPSAPPTCVPPPTVDRKSLDEIVGGAAFVARMLFSVTGRIFAGDPILQARDLGTHHEITAFIERWNQPRYLERATWFFRPDLLLTRDGFKAVEINVGPSLGGPGPCDILTKAYQAWVTTSMDSRGNIEYEAMGRNWIAGLKRRIEEHTGVRHERPTFCSIVPNDSIDLRDDFSLTDFQRLIEQHGMNYVYGSVERLDFLPDGVTLDGQKLDIVFTDFCYSKFVRAGGRFETLHRLMEADERGDILFCSPPHHVIYDQKLALRYLSEERYRPHFSQDEWIRLQQHVPLTTALSQETGWSISENHQDWVLKPKFSFGGQGVVVGRGMGRAEWDDKLASALQQADAYVVQRFVDDQLDIADPNLGHVRLACFGPLFNYGQYIGSLYRDIQRRDDSSRIINAMAGARYASIRVSSD
jgi:hypothetical protein